MLVGVAIGLYFSLRSPKKVEEKDLITEKDALEAEKEEIEDKLAKLESKINATDDNGKEDVSYKDIEMVRKFRKIIITNILYNYKHIF